MKHHLPRVLLLVALAATAACADDGPSDDGPSDAGPSDATLKCCPVETSPTCDCVFTGGTWDSPEPDPWLACPAICDSSPDDWVWDVDENGCPVLRTGSGSCLEPPTDAAPDGPGMDSGLAGDAGADGGAG